jgi:hypothetical protein
MSQDTELQRLSKKQSDRPSWVSDNTNADDTLIEPPQGFRQNQLSIDMTESKPPLNETPSNTVPNRLNMMGNQEEKKPTLYQRFLASIPPAPHIRKTVKASVAVLIGVIFALDAHLRTLFGSSALLITIVTIFFFPVRTIGK